MMDRYDDFYNSFITLFGKIERLENSIKNKENVDRDANDDIEVYDDEENIDIFNMSMPGPDDDNADIWLKK